VTEYTCCNASSRNFVNPTAVVVTLCCDFFCVRITANRTSKGLFTLVFTSGFFSYFFTVTMTCCISIGVNIRVTALFTCVSCVTLIFTGGSCYNCLVVVPCSGSKFCLTYNTLLRCCTCCCCTGGMSLCCNFCLYS